MKNYTSFVSVFALSLSAILIICSVPDGVVLDTDSRIRLLLTWPSQYWVTSLTMACIGTVGALLLVAPKHPDMAAVVVSCWLTPLLVPLPMMLASMLHASKNEPAVTTAHFLSFAVCVSAALLLGVGAVKGGRAAQYAFALWRSSAQ